MFDYKTLANFFSALSELFFVAVVVFVAVGGLIYCFRSWLNAAKCQMCGGTVHKKDRICKHCGGSPTYMNDLVDKIKLTYQLRLDEKHAKQRCIDFKAIEEALGEHKQLAGFFLRQDKKSGSYYLDVPEHRRIFVALYHHTLDDTHVCFNVESGLSNIKDIGEALVAAER